METDPLCPPPPHLSSPPICVDMLNSNPYIQKPCGVPYVYVSTTRRKHAETDKNYLCVLVMCDVGRERGKR